MNDPDTLLAELSTAIEAQRQAEAVVAVLRHALISRDLPREWYFSHRGYSTWRRDEPGRVAFTTLLCTRAEVESKLGEAVRALPLNCSEQPLTIVASASCVLTHETVDLILHIDQVEPACLRSEGHQWSVLFDDRRLEDFPAGRRVTEGCPHCDGQKTTLTPHVQKPEREVSYEAPHHYPEGTVRRRLVAGS